jgi:hypothetical protein
MRVLLLGPAGAGEYRHIHIPLPPVIIREWICDCRQLYLTQELDLLCIGIVVVLTKSFIFLVTKNKYLAVNPPHNSAENIGVSQK